MSDHDRALERAAEVLWDDWRSTLPYLPDAVSARLEADWARRQARAAVTGYLDSLLEGLPAVMLSAAATALRNGHPHDGSDLDLAVDEDAQHALTAALQAARKELTG